MEKEKTGKELLEEIKLEKEKMIKEGKLKKEKPLPEISQEEIPYEIPENWVWCRLGEVAEIISKGTTPKGGENAYITKGIKFLRVENINNDGEIENKNIRYISEEIHTTQLKRSILKLDDILITIAGTLGKIGVVLEKDLPLNTNQAISFVRILNKNKVLSRYVFRMMSNPNIKERLLNNVKVTAIPNLTLEIINNCIIPLPPLSTQQKIVDYLESTMDKIKESRSLFEEALEKIKLQRIAILHKAITGQLTEQLESDGNAKDLLEEIKLEKEKMIKEGKIKKEKLLPEISQEEIPFDIPENWVWCRLGEVGEYKKGPFGSSLKKESFVSEKENTYKVYEQGNAIRKNIDYGKYYITEKKFKEMIGFEVNPGDLIISCAGTIGEIYKIPENAPKGIINQALMKVSLTKKLFFKFYEYCFSIFVLEKIKIDSQGTAIKNIPPFKVFKNYLFPLPPLSEQQRIVEIVERNFERLDEIEEMIKENQNKLELLEKSILEKVFRGEIIK